MLIWRTGYSPGNIGGAQYPPQTPQYPTQPQKGPYSHMLPPVYNNYGNGSGNLDQYNNPAPYDHRAAPFGGMANPASPTPSYAHHISNVWGSLPTAPPTAPPSVSPYDNNQQKQNGGYTGASNSGYSNWGQNYGGMLVNTSNSNFKNQNQNQHQNQNKANSQTGSQGRPSSRNSSNSKKSKRKQKGQQSSNLATATVVNNNSLPQSTTFKEFQLQQQKSYPVVSKDTKFAVPEGHGEKSGTVRINRMLSLLRIRLPIRSLKLIV